MAKYELCELSKKQVYEFISCFVPLNSRSKYKFSAFPGTLYQLYDRDYQYVFSFHDDHGWLRVVDCVLNKIVLSRRVSSGEMLAYHLVCPV